MKEFNITGICIPEKHYMADTSEMIEQIVKNLVDKGKYFTINRARQYGKTTTLNLLGRRLSGQYLVIPLSFEAADDYFISLPQFVNGTMLDIADVLRHEQVEKEIIRKWETPLVDGLPLRQLSKKITELCQAVEKEVILIIDEVDKSSDNQIFLSFLGMLRDKYLKCASGRDSTFQSVILAGVYDIKNLKLKMRDEEEHKYNSPWNIATKFNLDMSFSVSQIRGMLEEYEQDYHTGMNVMEMAGLIYDYTSGYPFLVSGICKIIDEEINERYQDRSAAWTKEGFLEAVKILLAEKNTLFESMVNKLEEYPCLRDMMYTILFNGRAYTYDALNTEIGIAEMFGFIKNSRGTVSIANRIFETVLYNLFLSLEEMQNTGIYKTVQQEKYRFIENGALNMELILERFIVCFSDIYGNRDEKFLEEDGRRLFLLFLRPIINGTGNYYIEARTRDSRRTDVIVDYLGKQYIIELKIWHGEEYNRRGEEQIGGYLDDYHLKKGYMLSFNFNKEKRIGVKEVVCGDKVIVEAVV